MKTNLSNADLSKLWTEKASYYHFLTRYLMACALSIEDVFPLEAEDQGFPPKDKAFEFYNYAIEKIGKREPMVIDGKKFVLETDIPLLNLKERQSDWEESFLAFVKDPMRYLELEIGNKHAFVDMASCGGHMRDLCEGMATSRMNPSDTGRVLLWAENYGSLLSAKAWKLIGYWKRRIERDVKRTKKATERKRTEKEKRKQKVLEKYYQTDIIKGNMKPYTVARIIRESFSTKEPLSTDSIKRYLKEEGII